MKSDDEDNVISFDGMIKLDADIDIPVEKVIKGAQEAQLVNLLIVGEKEDGELYLASSAGKLSEIYWMLAQVQKELLDMSSD